MRPSDLAAALDAEATALRNHAAAIMVDGEPVTVPWGPNGATKTLHELTAIDMIEEACLVEADAKKLRTLYT